MLKILLYHVYPVRGSCWCWNVDRMLSYAHQFDAIMLGAVKDHRTDIDVLEYVKAIADDSILDRMTMFSCPNNPALREVTTWHSLWALSELRRKREDAYICYAHSKGVTHKDWTENCPVARWTKILYKTTFDVERVAALLEHSTFVGSCLKTGRAWPDSTSQWHYSGAFYWCRASDIRGRWREVDHTWHGVESWPGKLGFGLTTSIVGVGTHPEYDLYKLEQVERLESEYEKWK